MTSELICPPATQSCLFPFFPFRRSLSLSLSLSVSPPLKPNQVCIKLNNALAWNWCLQSKSTPEPVLQEKAIMFPSYPRCPGCSCSAYVCAICCSWGVLTVSSGPSLCWWMQAVFTGRWGCLLVQLFLEASPEWRCSRGMLSSSSCCPLFSFFALLHLSSCLTCVLFFTFFTFISNTWINTKTIEEELKIKRLKTLFYLMKAVSKSMKNKFSVPIKDSTSAPPRPNSSEWFILLNVC